MAKSKKKPKQKDKGLAKAVSGVATFQVGLKITSAPAPPNSDPSQPDENQRSNNT